MSTSIRQLLRRSPVVRNAYLACKRAAHSMFPPDLPAPQHHPQEPAPAPIAAVEPPPPTAGTRPVPDDDLNIYKQYPPHVLYTFAEKHAVFRDALKAYSSITVDDEPSGLYTDP